MKHISVTLLSLNLAKTPSNVQTTLEDRKRSHEIEAFLSFPAHAQLDRSAILNTNTSSPPKSRQLSVIPDCSSLVISKADTLLDLLCRESMMLFVSSSSPALHEHHPLRLSNRSPGMRLAAAFLFATPQRTISSDDLSEIWGRRICDREQRPQPKR